jgi:hypothetical protein
MNEELRLKYKIGKFYKYAEHRVGDRVEFGWVPAEDVDTPAVISYNSKSQSVTEEQAEWSKEEGVNATSLSDYRRYFAALTGDEAEDFLDKWEDKLADFPTHWASLQSNYTEEQGKFVVALARLIVDEKKFSMFGRVYKVIS